MKKIRVTPELIRNVGAGILGLITLGVLRRVNKNVDKLEHVIEERVPASLKRMEENASVTVHASFVEMGHYPQQEGK